VGVGMLKEDVLNTVENIINENASIVFICESPHTDELHHCYPLAGDAGREISKYLLGRYDIPFGLAAKNKAVLDALGLYLDKDFSVINVSKEPLQKSAYDNNGLDYPDRIEVMAKLKELIDKGAVYATQHRNPKLNEFKGELYRSFKATCEKHIQNCKVIVPCGGFAATFCEHLLKDSTVLNLELVSGVPHPSFGWSDISEDILEKIAVRTVGRT